MADYKKIDLQIGTEEQFEEKKLSLPVGTLVGITDPIHESELDTDLQTKINEVSDKLTAPTTPTADSVITMLVDGTVGTKPLSEIGGGGGSSVTVDSALSSTSENPVQNKVINSALNGKYEKPTGGIPKTDLSSAVQTSLGKADSALQSHQQITTGSANGTISVGGTDVPVKGLGSIAYKNILTKFDVSLGAVINAGQDSTPIANSANYVTSGGVKNYVDTAISGISVGEFSVLTQEQVDSLF